MNNPLTLLPCGLPKYAVEATHAACAAATERYGDRYDTSTVEEMAKRVAEVLDPVFDRLRELLDVVAGGGLGSDEAASAMDELTELLNL